MEARAKLLGHPIHQMLIVLPLGLFAGSVVFDILNLVTSSARWADAAMWMIVAGVAGGLVAAVFGTVDWMGIPRGTRAKTVGAVHGLGNVVVVLLFAGSAIARLLTTPNPTPAIAIVLSFLGAALTLVTGWLGGELVNRLGIGVHEGANADAPCSLSRRPASTTLITGANGRRADIPGRTLGEDAPSESDSRAADLTRPSYTPPRR